MMALKTFNIEDSVYKKFSSVCKGQGISMSKQVEFFMRSMVEKEPELKEEYVKRIEELRKGPFIRVDNFAKRYGLKQR
jgi:hypothetical protein